MVAAGTLVGALPRESISSSITITYRNKVERYVASYSSSGIANTLQLREVHFFWMIETLIV